MDQLVKDISKHSQEGEFNLLIGKLQSSSDLISSQDVGALDAVLGTLEPDKHSLGYIAILCGRHYPKLGRSFIFLYFKGGEAE